MGSLAGFIGEHEGGQFSNVSIEELVQAVLDSRRVTRRERDEVPITGGGYTIDRAGMEEWRDDVRGVLDYIASTDYAAYEDLATQYEEWDPNGWKTVVGTVFHEGDQQLVDIGIIIGDEGAGEPQEETPGIPDYGKDPTDQPTDEIPPPRDWPETGPPSGPGPVETTPDEQEPQPPGSIGPDTLMPDLEHEQPTEIPGKMPDLEHEQPVPIDTEEDPRNPDKPVVIPPTAAFYLEMLREAHLHALHQGKRMNRPTSTEDRILGLGGDIDDNVPFETPSETRAFDGAVNGFLSNWGMDKPLLIELLVAAGVSNTDLAYAWDIPTVRNVEQMQERGLTGGVESQVGVRFEDQRVASGKPEFFSDNPLVRETLGYTQGSHYKPDNWFTDRMGKDITPSADTIGRLGGDPRRPGVQVGMSAAESQAQYDNWMGGVERQLAGADPDFGRRSWSDVYQNQLGAPETDLEGPWVTDIAGSERVQGGFDVTGYGPNYQHTNPLIPVHGRDYLIDILLGAPFTPAGGKAIGGLVRWGSGKALASNALRMVDNMIPASAIRGLKNVAGSGRATIGEGMVGRHLGYGSHAVPPGVGQAVDIDGRLDRLGPEEILALDDDVLLARHGGDEAAATTEWDEAYTAVHGDRPSGPLQTFNEAFPEETTGFDYSPGFSGDPRMKPDISIAGEAFGTGPTVRVSSHIIYHTGADNITRPIILVDLGDGQLQPFYRRTGTGSEVTAGEVDAIVTGGGGGAGQWVPFDGIGTKAKGPNWYRKGPYDYMSPDDPLFRYGSEELKAVGEMLDEHPYLAGIADTPAMSELNEGMPYAVIPGTEDRIRANIVLDTRDLMDEDVIAPETLNEILGVHDTATYDRLPYSGNQSPMRDPRMSVTGDPATDQLINNIERYRAEVQGLLDTAEGQIRETLPSRSLSAGANMGEWRRKFLKGTDTEEGMDRALRKLEEYLVSPEGANMRMDSLDRPEIIRLLDDLTDIATSNQTLRGMQGLPERFERLHSSMGNLGVEGPDPLSLRPPEGGFMIDAEDQALTDAIKAGLPMPGVPTGDIRPLDIPYSDEVIQWINKRRIKPSAFAAAGAAGAAAADLYPDSVHKIAAIAFLNDDLWNLVKNNTEILEPFLGMVSDTYGLLKQDARGTGDPVIDSVADNKFRDQVHMLRQRVPGAVPVAGRHSGAALDNLKDAGLSNDTIQKIKAGDALIMGYQGPLDAEETMRMAQHHGVHINPEQQFIWEKPSVSLPTDRDITRDDLKKAAAANHFYPGPGGATRQLPIRPKLGR